MKSTFITFGGGSRNYIEAGSRLLNQANNLNLFDKTIFIKDIDLKQDDDFWNKHGIFIENNKRGYGYWIWKPYIIKNAMDNMNDGDILLYLDCGCEINIQKREDIINYFNIVKKDYIIGTPASIEKEFNKMDLVLKLNMLDNNYLDSRQRQSGAIMFLVCDKTRKLVNEWHELSQDYHNIDDTPSISTNLTCFKEHRHDQSIFSLLTKKYDLYSEYTLNCIEYSRNRTGISII